MTEKDRIDLNKRVDRFDASSYAERMDLMYQLSFEKFRDKKCSHEHVVRKPNGDNKCLDCGNEVEELDNSNVYDVTKKTCLENIRYRYLELIQAMSSEESCFTMCTEGTIRLSRALPHFQQ